MSSMTCFCEDNYSALGKCSKCSRLNSSTLDQNIGQELKDCRISKVGDRRSYPTDSLQSPLTGVRLFANGNVPGVVGICNHGSTCFVSTVIQCLSNTKHFTEYFINDLHRSRLVAAQNAGGTCIITDRLAQLIESLWTCRYRGSMSRHFVDAVSQQASNFAETKQNDAQEFLLWILNTINDELCGDKNGDLLNTQSVNKSEDKAVASCSVSDLMPSSSGIVGSLFVSCFRSVLTCPTCKEQSSTTEPFMCVPLPLPEKYKIPIYATVVKFHPSSSWFKIVVSMSSLDTVKELRQSLEQETGIPAHEVLLVEILKSSGFGRTYTDEELLCELELNEDSICAIQLHSDSCSSMSTTSEHVFVVALNVVKNTGKDKVDVVGHPIVTCVFRDASLSGLHSNLLYEMNGLLKSGSLAELHDRMQLSSCLTPFHMVVVGHNGVMDNSYLPEDNKILPLLTPAVDQILSCWCAEDGPQHVKLLVEWETFEAERWMSPELKTASPDTTKLGRDIHETVDDSQKTMSASLDECFTAFTSNEKLDVDETWFCPKCSANQKGAIKTLCLSALPDILIIQLKRFKQVGNNRTKLNQLIDFPVNGLDVRQYSERLVDADGNPRDNSHYIYDLYAVCNHYGSLHSGHYTAFCKNPVNKHWYAYNDEKVSELMSESEVVTKAAYLLFYQRRVAVNRCDVTLTQWLDAVCNATFDDEIDDLKKYSASVTSNKRTTPLESGSTGVTYSDRAVLGKTAASGYSSLTSMAREVEQPSHDTKDRPLKLWSPAEQDQVNGTRIISATGAGIFLSPENSPRNSADRKAPLYSESFDLNSPPARNYTSSLTTSLYPSRTHKYHSSSGVVDDRVEMMNNQPRPVTRNIPITYLPPSSSDTFKSSSLSHREQTMYSPSPNEYSNSARYRNTPLAAAYRTESYADQRRFTSQAPHTTTVPVSRVRSARKQENLAYRLPE